MELSVLKRLDALAPRLSSTRTVVIHVALARLAELERVEVPPDED